MYIEFFVGRSNIRILWCVISFWQCECRT